MPFEITLKDLTVGYAAESKPKGSTGTINVRVTGFASSEDGEELINVLEGVSGAFISLLPKEARIHESGIDHLVVVVRKDRTATVYVNELKLISTVQTKKVSVNAGDPITVDDVADVRKMRIEGVKIPDDAGVVIILSSRWRKAVFYDYFPIVSSPAEPRAFDVEVILAQMWIRLLFQDRFKITNSEWDELFKKKWFPFISLGGKRIREMLNHLRNSWDLDQLIDDIEKDVISRIPAIKSQLTKGKCFEGHRDILNEALDNFISGKYISTTGVLYPRLEGVMRSRHGQVDPGTKASQTKLTESATADPLGTRHELSLLMPDRFKEYLEEVYFANFDPKNVSDVSRNTVSHGVAPEKMLADKKSAVIGVLILEQLAFICA